MTRIYRCRPFSGRGGGRGIEKGSKAITERTQTCFCDDADLPLQAFQRSRSRSQD